MDDDEELPRYSLLQVLTHDIPSDCWVIVYDRVYDLTNFLYKVSLASHEKMQDQESVSDFIPCTILLASRWGRNNLRIRWA